MRKNPLEFLHGLWTTFRSMFERPVTYQYPEIKRPVLERFRGRHELKSYENGLERCIGFALCAAACPADAIFVEADENTDEKRYSPGECYASPYEINMLRCIFCGFFEDACPTQAIVLEHSYELSYTDRRQAIYTKEKLIVQVPKGGQPTPMKVPPGSFSRAFPEMQAPDQKWWICESMNTIPCSLILGPTYEPRPDLIAWYRRHCYYLSDKHAS